jgi:hypothetical protein
MLWVVDGEGIFSGWASEKYIAPDNNVNKTNFFIISNLSEVKVSG